MQSLPQADNPKRLPYGPNDAAQDGYDLVTEEWRPTDNEELKRTIERLERKNSPSSRQIFHPFSRFLEPLWDETKQGQGESGQRENELWSFSDRSL
jgi:hypothetical protein